MSETSTAQTKPQTFDELTSSAVHVDAPMGAVGPTRALNTMRSRLKTKMRRGKPLTTKDIDEAHKHAKLRAMDPVTANEADGEPVQMCDGGDVFPKLAKADPVVEYRMASANNPTDDGDGDIDACGSCRFFQWGRCQLVEGTIEADHVCSLFHETPVLFAPDLDGEDDAPDDVAAYAETPFAFAELKPFAEPPAWIQYMPTPGTYTHPTYGKVDLSKQRIANFVSQFNAGIYQTSIPIDAEHQTKLSGATGYIKEMRIASDGSAEARVEWTDRGEKLIRGDRHKSFSPEWFDTWTDPVDEKVYRDVAIGGALTTRPFFKGGVLRPIVASEAGAIVWADDLDAAEASTPLNRQGATQMAENNTTPAAPIGMTEEQIKRFNELETSFKASEEARIAAENTAKQANDRALKLELDGRTKKFTDEVRGRSDASGAVWRFAEPSEFVAHLEDLTQAFGEDSAQVAFFTKTMRQASSAFAEVTKDSNLFKSFGSDAPGGEAEAAPFEALMTQARAYSEAHPGTSPEVAFAEIVTKDPKNKTLVSQL